MILCGDQSMEFAQLDLQLFYTYSLITRRKSPIHQFKFGYKLHSLHVTYLRDSVWSEIQQVIHAPLHCSFIQSISSPSFSIDKSVWIECVPIVMDNGSIWTMRMRHCGRFFFNVAKPCMREETIFLVVYWRICERGTLTQEHVDWCACMTRCRNACDGVLLNSKVKCESKVFWDCLVSRTDWNMINITWHILITIIFIDLLTNCPVFHICHFRREFLHFVQREARHFPSIQGSSGVPFEFLQTAILFEQKTSNVYKHAHDCIESTDDQDKPASFYWTHRWQLFTVIDDV